MILAVNKRKSSYLKLHQFFLVLLFKSRKDGAIIHVLTMLFKGEELIRYFCQQSPTGPGRILSPDPWTVTLGTK